MKKIIKQKDSELLSGFNDPLEKLLRGYFEIFTANNRAARVVTAGLRVVGVGLRPLVDHMTFRALDAQRRAAEFLDYGYVRDKKKSGLESENASTAVYRKSGYPPILIEEAAAKGREKGNPIAQWVKAFGDQAIYQLAVQVDDIEQAAFYIEKQGIPMAGNIMGNRGSDLRQVLTLADFKNNKPLTVLQLTERHRGFSGFCPQQ